MGKIVILMGMSCAGKDRIRRELEEWGYKNIVSHTCRPIRENEIKGEDYYFISKEEFENMIDNEKMIEYRSYNTLYKGIPDKWYYGVKKFSLIENTDYVIVIDLMGAENIIKYFGEENCILIYVNTSDEIRKERAINRGSFDETEWSRRLLADYKDFSYNNLQTFMNKYKVWQIENEKYGNNAIDEIAGVINFIKEERLH